MLVDASDSSIGPPPALLAESFSTFETTSFPVTPSTSAYKSSHPLFPSMKWLILPIVLLVVALYHFYTQTPQIISKESILTLDYLHSLDQEWEFGSIQKQTQMTKNEKFGYWCDGDALKYLISQLCSTHPTFVTGGLNKGKLAKEIMQTCPSLRLYGVEIQESAWKEATNLLKEYPNVKTFHMGWGNESRTMTWHGQWEGAGFYESNDVIKDGEESGQQVEVTTLVEFTLRNGIEKITYLLVDAEGYETPIIQGMKLEQNRAKFPAFQYELGGTWIRSDPRHPQGSWSQFITALYLESLGYQLYLIGCDNFMRVGSFFFSRTSDEAAGGNCLAIHPDYADPLLLSSVNKRALYLK